jgi:hypothetical protein
MATNTQTSGDVPVSDYQTIPKPRARLDPEAQFAPTCMMWCIALGLGVLVCMVLAWSLPHVLKLLSAG